jgi:hypothetical protein
MGASTIRESRMSQQVAITGGRKIRSSTQELNAQLPNGALVGELETFVSDVILDANPDAARV